MSAAAQKKVLIAGLFHETNTFLEGRTRLDDFQVLRGEAIREAAGDASPLAGVIEAAVRFGWLSIPAIDMRAMPGPTVEDRVLSHFWHVLERVANETAPFDGVLLVLHGAMVSESMEDVEGAVLGRMRQLPAFDGVPICGVLDLHANFTPEMARHADALIAYRENPHADAKQTATRAADILARLMSTGERPSTALRRAGILWPATGTGTAEEPMRSLEDRAREIEWLTPEILAVNVFAGFAYADVAEAGVSFTAVTTGNPSDAEHSLERLAGLAHQNRAAGNAAEMPPAEMPLDDAMERLKQHTQGPVLLVEPSDNIGAGTSGRGVAVLKALLDHGIQNSAAVVQAPEAVAELAHLCAGGRASITLPPLKLDVELISSSNGKFTLEDPHSHLASMAGERIDMGPCAVVRCGGVRILLTSRKTPPFDLGQLRSQGIVPEDLFAIVVKAAVAHRRAYGPIAKASYTVETPGPCTGNLRTLPYRRVRRPIYPLD